MKVQKLTEKKIEKLAMEIRKFLLEHDMWIDTSIYFNGRCFSTYDSNLDRYFYNDPNNLIARENENPWDYFDCVNPEHILSMSFEGPVCKMLYYGEYPGLKKKFDKIFEKYGLCYEFGDHWNFSCYYI